MKITELNHVALEVKSVQESIIFYKKLGLQSLPRPAFDFEGAWFRLGEVQELHLIGGRERDVVSAKRGTHFALQVASLAEAEVHLQNVGISYQGPFKRPDGAQQLFLSDPDGHVVELCQLKG